MHHIDIRSIYEDNHLLVIDKPAGTLCQGDKTGDPSLVDMAKLYVKEKYGKPGKVFLGLCHRLDRPVSGALVLARTSKALTRMNRMFADGDIDKTYLAITVRCPPASAGVIEQWLIKDRTSNTVKSHRSSTAGAKRAITHYELMGETKSKYLLRVSPLTGRSHQIRVAMQSIGCPILGDVKYGGAPLDRHSIALHCFSMHFIHPVRKEALTTTTLWPASRPWTLFSHWEAISIKKE